MEPTIIHIADVDDVTAEMPTVGWYVRDGRDVHGEFSEYAEAAQFVDYLEREQRIEARHNRSLRYPGC